MSGWELTPLARVLLSIDHATTTPADAARFEAHFHGTDPEPPDFDYAAEAELAEQIKRREARTA